MTQLRALTVRPPWSWAIGAGEKGVENRSKPFSYRGPLLIHAAVSWSVRGAHSPLVRKAWWSTVLPDLDPLTHGAIPPPSKDNGTPVHPSIRTGPAAAAIDFGAIIAIAELADCHRASGCCEPWGEDAYVQADGERRTEIFHLVLEDVVRLDPPVPAVGHLGLWTPPPDVVALLPESVR